MNQRTWTSGKGAAADVLTQTRLTSIPLRVSVFAVLCLALGSSAAWAQDRVLVQPSGQSSRITVVGRIQDFTGRELVLQTGVGAGLQRFAAADVIEVQTTYQPLHEQGRQHLRAGQADAAWTALNRAWELEDRKWVRREILALLVECALQLRRYSDAATRFLLIAESDPATVHHRLLPLVWTEVAEPEMSAADARVWLNSDVARAKLIGASWLLQGADRDNARLTLQLLATDSDPLVQRLAQAQLWRLRLEEPNLSSEELRRWEILVEDWPTFLRAGPLFLIGRGYAARQEWLSASAAWLWLPLEWQARRDLAAEALWRAARAQELVGDLPAAERLAREFLRRYPGSPQTALVLEFVERLSPRAVPATMP